jgi:serine protease Do
MRLLCLLVVVFAGSLHAETPTIEKLTASLKPSLVAVSVLGRDGKNDGLGTGFVLTKDGLIATNAHVIGEGRPIKVEFPDGKSFEVKSIHAIDRVKDLAILKIDASDLKPLALSDSDQTEDGQAVVALGNPKGLKFSVVSGVISGQREISGQKMIQVAMPIEPGNSGGPLVDRQGRVLGVISMKSLVTENLGFAIGANALKPLLAKPNPIPMQGWLTIGQLDPEDWKAYLGANWTQRAGKIKVDGVGSGFGGRSFLINQTKLKKLPLEVSVDVKLEDERGAAGLLFQHDGEVHYGLYPSGGKIRVTHFLGNDVYSWKILGDFPTPAYRRGDWNTLKLKITADEFTGFVNGQQILKIANTMHADQQIGLAKFRDTKAEFKNFRFGEELKEAVVDKKLIADVTKQSNPEALANIPNASHLLREQAAQLEREAAKLRERASSAHQFRVIGSVQALLKNAEKDVDLVNLGLHLAWLDNEDLDIEAYRKEVDRLTAKLRSMLPKEMDDQGKFKTLNQFFFDQRGFHGARGDYYNRSNSYLNEVLDDREGIPITLSLIYMELGRRIGLTMEGVGLPGHFVVRFIPTKGDPIVLDVFERGEVIKPEEVKKRATLDEDQGPDPSLIAAMSKRAIFLRMIRNLLNISQQEQDAESGLRYLNLVLALEPDSARDRFMRAGLLILKERKSEARIDVEYLLEHPSEEVPVAAVRRLEQALTSN